MSCSYNNSTVADTWTDSLCLAVGVLSASVSLLAIAALYYYKLYYSFNYRLVLYLLLAITFELIIQIMNFFVTAWYNPQTLIIIDYCKVLAVSHTYALWIIAMFTLIFIAEVLSMITCFIQLRRLEVPFVASSLFLPLAFVWVPLITDSFGPLYYECWIPVQHENCTYIRVNVIERVILWYIPVCVSCTAGVGLLMIAVGILIVRSCKEKLQHKLSLFMRQRLC